MSIRLIINVCYLSSLLLLAVSNNKNFAEAFISARRTTSSAWRLTTRQHLPPQQQQQQQHDSIRTTRTSLLFAASQQQQQQQQQLSWFPIPVSSTSLPTIENEVKLIDTELVTLKNGATNPTGAVAVVKYESETYCFSSSCPSCKIPLVKAKVLPPNDETKNNEPRIRCDFCKATYNIQTGEKLTTTTEDDDEKAGGGVGGILGGFVKNVFASQESGPLPTYKLGAKENQMYIALPPPPPGI